MMNTKERNAWVAENLPLISNAVRKTLMGFGRMPSEDEVSDLTGDCVVALLADKLERFDDSRGVKLTTYVVTCVRNMTIDAMRKMRPTNSYDTTEGGRDEEGEAMDVLPSHAMAPDAACATAERLRLIRSELSADEMSDLDAYMGDYDDAADAMRKGISLSNARKRKSLLMSRVRSLVE